MNKMVDFNKNKSLIIGALFGVVTGSVSAIVYYLFVAN